MGTGYTPSWLAEFLHSFPHYDLTFQEVNATFKPFETKEPRYKESLVFWAALPILWLLLTLLLFLVYFCYRCCQRDVEKKQDVPCLRWSLAILAIVTCGAIGLGFYGNEITNVGVKTFTSSVGKSDAFIDELRSEVGKLGHNINSTVKEGIDALNIVYTHYPSVLNDDKDRRLQRQISQSTTDSYDYAHQILQNVETVRSRARRVNTSALVAYLEEYGFYRWIVAVVLLGWMVLLCLVLLLGVGLSSKCTLLVFCAFGIFTLVLCWLASGFHLGLSVGLGDLCVAPEVFFQRTYGNNNEMDMSVIRYYIKCGPGEDSPFNGAVQNAHTNLQRANRTLQEAKHLAITERKIRQSEIDGPVRTVVAGLNDASEHIRRIGVLMDCRNVNRDFHHGIQGICYSAMPGVALLVLSFVATGLLFTVLVLLASIAWRHFTRSEKYSEYVYNTEERVPLQNVEDGSHYSYTRGRHGHGREQMQLQQRGSTPPPAYNSNTFYRTQDNYMNHSIPDDQSDFARETIA